jgi:hypothetical protein
METPLSVTALVKTHSEWEDRVEMLDLQDIGEEFDQLEDLFGNSGIPVQVLPDMQYAAAGWGDDIVEGPEIFDEQIIASAGEMLESRIGHGLPATGLVGRVDDFASQLFQQLQRSDTRLWIKLIDITGYE